MAIKKDYKKLTQQTKKKKQAKTAAQDGFKEDKEKRLIRLIRLIRIADGGVLNEDRAAHECGVSKRTIQRDIKVLSDAGIPLRKKNDLNSNYHLGKEWKIQHYNINKKNALAFLRSYRALSYFHDNTDELVSPLQKDMLDIAAKRYRIDYSVAKVKQNKDIPNPKPKPLSQEEFVSFLSLVDTSKAEVQECILGSLAFDMYLRRNPFDAIKLNERLLSLNPRSKYYCWIGYSHYKLKNYEKAREIFLKAIEQDPYNRWAYCHMAQTYQAENNASEAVSWFKKGLKIMPKDAVLHTHLMVYLMDIGEYKEALKHIPYCNQKKFREYAIYAYLYKKLNDYKQALKYINKAIEAAPDKEYLIDEKQEILAKASLKEKSKQLQNNKPAQKKE